jgi:hypothetical protein
MCWDYYDFYNNARRKSINGVNASGSQLYFLHWSINTNRLARSATTTPSLSQTTESGFLYRHPELPHIFLDKYFSLLCIIIIIFSVNIRRKLNLVVPSIVSFNSLSSPRLSYHIFIFFSLPRLFFFKSFSFKNWISSYLTTYYSFKLFPRIRDLHLRIYSYRGEPRFRERTCYLRLGNGRLTTHPLERNWINCCNFFI